MLAGFYQFSVGDIMFLGKNKLQISCYQERGKEFAALSHVCLGWGCSPQTPAFAMWQADSYVSCPPFQA